MTFNLHRVRSVRVLPPDSYNTTVWQSIVVEFEGGNFQLTLFPNNPDNLPLVAPTKVEEIGLTAINLSTIKVGDTVKLVSDAHLNEGWARDLTLGNTYRVVEVDHDSTNMPIMISDDIQDHIWAFAEDFQQVV